MVFLAWVIVALVLDVYIVWMATRMFVTYSGIVSSILANAAKAASVHRACEHARRGDGPTTGINKGEIGTCGSDGPADGMNEEGTET